MYTVAMAYCGSGNNKAIRRLLHVAVSTLIFFRGKVEGQVLQVDSRGVGYRYHIIM